MPITAFLFPGHGSQEVGMAADLFKCDNVFASYVDHANTITGFDLRHLCLKGPDTILTRSEYVQPLLVAVSLGYWHHVCNAGIHPDFVLGHSSGELTALAASGVVTPLQAIEIAAMRGKLMDAAASAVNGGMMAVLFAHPEAVRQLLDEKQFAKTIVLANENADDQLVVSGEKELLLACSRIIVERRIGRCLMLPMSGPWHSPAIQSAYKQFVPWVKSIQFAAPSVNLVMNASCRTETDPERIKELSSGQLVKPVYFKGCMQYLKEKGVDVLIEIGPGRVLHGLARVNGFKANSKVFSVNSLKIIENLAKELQQS